MGSGSESWLFTTVSCGVEISKGILSAYAFIYEVPRTYSSRAESLTGKGRRRESVTGNQNLLSKNPGVILNDRRALIPAHSCAVDRPNRDGGKLSNDRVQNLQGVSLRSRTTACLKAVAVASSSKSFYCRPPRRPGSIEHFFKRKSQSVPCKRLPT